MNLTNKRIILGSNELINKKLFTEASNNNDLIIISDFNNKKEEYENYLLSIGYKIINVNIETGENIEINLDNYNKEELFHFFRKLFVDDDFITEFAIDILVNYYFKNLKGKGLTFHEILENINNHDFTDLINQKCNDTILRSAIICIEIMILSLIKQEKVATNIPLKEILKNNENKLAIVLSGKKYSRGPSFLYLILEEIKHLYENNLFRLNIFSFYNEEETSIKIYKMFKNILQNNTFKINFFIDKEFINTPEIIENQESDGDSFILTSSINESIKRKEISIIKNIVLLQELSNLNNLIKETSYKEIAIPKNKFIIATAMNNEIGIFST